MNTTYKRQKNKLIALIIVTLFLFTSSVAYYIYESNRSSMMQQVDSNMEIELNLLSEYMKDYLYRNDYAEAKNFLTKWVKNEESVVYLTIRLRNNQELFSYEKEKIDMSNCCFASKSVVLNTKDIKIRLGHNIIEVNKSLHNLKQILYSYTVISTVAFAFILWLLLSKWILKPIKEEITKQTKTIKDYSNELGVINLSYRALSDSNIALTSSNSEEELLKEVCEIIHIDCGYKLVWIGYCEENVKGIRIKAVAGDSTGYLKTLDTSWNKKGIKQRGPIEESMSSKKPIITNKIDDDNNLEPWRREALQYNLHSCANFPIMSQESLIGVLCVYQDRESAFIDEEISLLKELSLNLGFGIIALRDRKEVERLSNYDHLTGFFNRYKSEQLLKYEIDRSRRYKNSLSIVIIDIDHFKEVNDTFGHNIGDKILQEFSKVLQKERRKVDFVCRWGGEEFLIILPDTDLKQGVVLAQKLQEEIRNTAFTSVGKKTASFGVASFKEEDSLESLVDRSDKALYLAKDRGRDCIIDETMV